MIDITGKICIILILLECHKLQAKVYFNRPQDSALKSSRYQNVPPIPVPDPPLLLNSWLPVAIQALTYYPEMLQYEQTYMTTIAPPFYGSSINISTSPHPTYPTTAQTNPVSWWVTSTTSTARPPPPPPQQTWPTPAKPPQDPYYTQSTTQRPPATTTQGYYTKPTTQGYYTKPTTQRPPQTTETPGYVTTTKKTTWPQWSQQNTRPTTTVRTTWPQWSPPSTTSKKPTVWWSPTTTQYTTTSPWWVPPSTTLRPTQRPETTFWTTTTTPKPHTTLTRPPDSTTQAHPPGVYAPPRPWYLIFADPDANGYVTSNNIVIRTTTKGPNKEFMQWFMQSKPKQLSNDIEYNYNLLDPLPKKLLETIAHEKDHQPAQDDIDNLNEFRRLYDDSWAFRYQSVTGKKKIPPTKPYVEMLLLLDLFKKDAKRLALNKYQGYGPEILRELHRISFLSSEHQLYEILRKVYEQNEYEGARTRERLVNLIADAADPNSVLSKNLRYIPPLTFLP